jgi:hypothetical protein
MATRHTSTAPVSTQPKSLSKTKLQSLTVLLREIMSPEHFAKLTEHSESYGTSLDSHVFEALCDHVEVCLPAREDVWIETIRRKDRAESKAEKSGQQDRQIAEYLAKLESKLDPLPPLL